VREESIRKSTAYASRGKCGFIGIKNLKNMQAKLFFTLMFATIFSSSQTILAQQEKVASVQDVVEIARMKNIDLPDLPWHTMVIHWNFKDSIPDFQRLDIDINIDRDVSSDYNLYISPITSAFNGEKFYGGLQTNIGGWKSKTDHTRINPGKGGIFSRWSKTEKEPIGLEYVDVLDNGLCESAGYEGEFCSVRRPYSWTKGTYQFSLIKEETILFKEKPHTWVRMEFANKANAETFSIGRLLFEGDTLKMNQSMGTFVEIYGYKKSVPEAAITFGCPQINGKEIDLEMNQVFAMQTLSGLPSSPNVAHVTSENNDVTVHISPNVQPQTKNPIYQVIMLDKMQKKP
jgi:hypothetical protein